MRCCKAVTWSLWWVCTLRHLRMLQQNPAGEDRSGYEAWRRRLWGNLVQLAKLLPAIHPVKLYQSDRSNRLQEFLQEGGAGMCCWLVVFQTKRRRRRGGGATFKFNSQVIELQSGRVPVHSVWLCSPCLQSMYKYTSISARTTRCSG